jgi:uncharacterized membrane protein
VAIVRDDLLPVLSKTARVDVFGFAEGVAATSPDSLVAEGRTTRLMEAIESVRARYQGRRVPGIVVLSDGGETGGVREGSTAQGPPVFTVGLGSTKGLADREVTELTAGDPRLDQAAVDLQVSAVARGFGREAASLRLLADGRIVETRQVEPVAEGLPLHETFTVFPNPERATVYTAEITAGPGEAVLENNSRSVVVNPVARKRRVLAFAGAPGFDHTFLIRALQRDPSLDVDAVVRKGRNEDNRDTFLVQASGGRAAALTTGFPTSREALFEYDVIVLANIEGDFFSRAQLDMTAEFVERRGGGLLVLGGRSFERRGLTGTALEDVLPLELGDRRGAAVRAPGEEGPAGHDTVVLTEEGARHPIMRIGPTSESSKRLWATLPPLASNARVGGPRPGASVLAVTASSSGAVLPVVAVQRYGRGRSMMFAGEASWRWQMLSPAGDRRYEFFWRQALRWLATDAPDVVTLTLDDAVDIGEPSTAEFGVRDRTFLPVDAAALVVTLTAPGGSGSTLPVRSAGAGRYVAAFTAKVAGLYRIQVEARRNDALLGVADRWFLVGSGEREFADPRLNEPLLRRLARESGGQYVPAHDAAGLAPLLAKQVPSGQTSERRDLWHEPWVFALLLTLLSAEWVLRRRWGLR